MARTSGGVPLIRFGHSRAGMQLGRAACLLIIFGIVLNAADQPAKFYPPTVSCFDATKKQPPPSEVLRTPVLVTPNQRYRAYAEMDTTFDQTLPQPCRTKAQLFVSSGKSPFKLAFVDKTSETDNAIVSLGPIAWSSDSRWLAVERFAGYYASDAGGVDFLLYDSTTDNVSTPNVLGAIAKKIGKDCMLGYTSFYGFDTRNRLILRVADWEEPDYRETHCIEGTAEWLFNPLTGDVQLSAP